jgi:hypothetical protein
MAKLVLSLNLQNFAATQYADYAFDSCCVTANKQPLGANADGIFMLEEPDHDEGDIEWFFVLPTSDLFEDNQKRIRKINVGGKLDDDAFTFSLSPDDDEPHDIDVYMDKTDLTQCSGRGAGRRDKFGRYWSVKVSGDQDFSLDAIDFEAVILGYNIKRR